MTESESPWTQQPARGPAPGLRYANVAERMLATFIDYIVAALAASTPYALISAGRPYADALLMNAGALLSVVTFFAVYGLIPTFWRGQSIGGRVLGIRIVRRSNGGSIRAWQGMLRPIGVLITAALWFISFFAVVLGHEKRTPADLLTATVVIKPIKGWSPA